MANWQQIKAMLNAAGVRYMRGTRVEERGQREIFWPMMLYTIDPLAPDHVVRRAFLPLDGATAAQGEPDPGTHYENEVVYDLLVDRLGMIPEVVAAGLQLEPLERRLFELRQRQRVQRVLVPEGDDPELAAQFPFLGVLEDSSNVEEDDPEVDGVPSLASVEWSESEASAEWESDDPR